MKCNKCGEKEVLVSISGYGDFCAECHNNMMIDWYGVNDLTSLREKISVCDEDGTVHHFKIRDMNKGGQSYWIATEVTENGETEIEFGYSFQVKTGIEREQFSALTELREKVVAGVSNKSCIISEKSQSGEPAAGKNKSLKKQGMLEIVKDTATQEIVFSIDGMRVTLAEFGQMLSAYEGNNLQFQIQDKTAPIMEKYMVLKQVDVSPEAIWERFQTILSWFVKDNFLNEKDRAACELLLAERLEDLILLHKSYSKSQALELGEKIRKALHEIETNFSGFSAWTEAYIDRIRERGQWLSDRD